VDIPFMKRKNREPGNETKHGYDPGSQHLAYRIAQPRRLVFSTGALFDHDPRLL